MLGPDSPMSGPVTVGTPTAATALKAVKAAPGAIKLTFKVPRSNGAPIIRYTATCKSNNGGATKAKSAKTAPLTVLGLTAGKTYTCVVTATNSRGTGAVVGRGRAASRPEVAALRIDGGAELVHVAFGVGEVAEPVPAKIPLAFVDVPAAFGDRRSARR